MFFTFILIIILIIWVFPSLLSWVVRTYFKHKLKRSFAGFQGQSGSAHHRDTRREGHQPKQPHTPAKKISKDVGEYVHFEEIEVNAEQSTYSNADGSQTTYTRVDVEEQVVDVEWEDIDDKK